MNPKESLGKAFDTANDSIDYALFIFMDYYGKMKYVLNKYCVAHRENYLMDANETSRHPLIEKKSIGKIVKFFNQFYLSYKLYRYVIFQYQDETAIRELDKRYFAENILDADHRFHFNDSGLECQYCRLTFYSFAKQLNCLKQFYLFKSDFLRSFRMLHSKKTSNISSYFEYNTFNANKKVKSNSASCKSLTGMSSRYFNVFKIKFPDTSYGCCDVKLSIDM